MRLLRERSTKRSHARQSIKNNIKAVSPLFDMNDYLYPKIKIQKNQIPILYLDTCALIEFSKYMHSKCTNEHKRELGELYDTLLSLMQQKRILCPTGNQLQEMGVSRGREKAREFLFRFTNATFRNPAIIEDAQMDLGYQSFSTEAKAIILDCNFVLDNKNFPGSPFFVHASPIYNQSILSELKREKLNGVARLNEMKENGCVFQNFDSQLKNELESDFWYFLRSLEHYKDSFESYIRCVDELHSAYRRTGTYSDDVSDPKYISAVENHNRFLLSNYHHKLPYKWIEAVLWAHRMRRPNKIQQGDVLDTVWAAAYLPFIDYAVTDGAFCDLLHESGLADQYGVKVYTFKTLDLLLKELNGNLIRLDQRCYSF